MKNLTPLALRVHLSLLILLAVAPFVALSLYAYFGYRKSEMTQARQDAMRLTQLAASEIEQVMEGMRQLVVTLSRIPAIRDMDPAASNALLADLLAQYPRYKRPLWPPAPTGSWPKSP